MPEFITLSQNVDGLSQRADHPRDQLKLLHGTLFEVKCTDDKCAYVAENFEDPIVPALGIPTDGRDPTTHKARHEVDISDASVHLPDIARENLPTCPQCKTSLLRPNVVWFGEQLPQHVLDSVGEFLEGHVDLIMVIGTSAQVTPAANYIFDARMRGARVCVVSLSLSTFGRLDVPWNRRCARQEGWSLTRAHGRSTWIPMTLLVAVGRPMTFYSKGTLLSSCQNC